MRPASSRPAASISEAALALKPLAALAATNGRNYDSIEQSAWTAYQLNCGDLDATGAPKMKPRDSMAAILSSLPW